MRRMGVGARRLRRSLFVEFVSTVVCCIPLDRRVRAVSMCSRVGLVEEVQAMRIRWQRRTMKVWGVYLSRRSALVCGVGLGSCA